MKTLTHLYILQYIKYAWSKYMYIHVAILVTATIYLLFWGIGWSFCEVIRIVNFHRNFHSNTGHRVALNTMTMGRVFESSFLPIFMEKSKCRYSRLFSWGVYFSNFEIAAISGFARIMENHTNANCLTSWLRGCNLRGITYTMYTPWI